MKRWCSFNKIYITNDENNIILKMKQLITLKIVSERKLQQAYDTPFHVHSMVIKSHSIGEVVCAFVRGGPKRH